MPQVKSIESRVSELEGFRIRIRDQQGGDVRSDKVIPARYDRYVNRAADSMTVAGWKRVRFEPQLAGYAVDVLMADGGAAHGGAHLRTVRASYK